LGAVLGSALATFLLLQTLGTRNTLWMACLINALIATLARVLARSLAADAAPSSSEQSESTEGAPASIGDPAPARRRFTLGAAALVGFVFSLMEIVWFRLFGPLLGGTVFTFNLILMVALLGIALGGTAYAAFAADRPATLKTFAYTSLLEALCLGIPFVLGDRIAVLTIFLRPIGDLGFLGHIFSWSLISMLVVFPAAF